MFEREVTFEQAQKHRLSQGIEHNTWKEYFARMRKSFVDGALTINDGGKAVTLICYYNNRPITSSYELLPVDPEFLRGKMARVVLKLASTVRRQVTKLFSMIV